MKSPLSAVKDKFGEKAKLIAELETLTKGDDLWVSRLNAKKGLAHVSNAKLLRLHETFTAVKEKFGTREKLIDAILELLKRSKDTGYKERLNAYPVPRLYDLYRSTAKRLHVPEPTAKKAKRPAAPAAAKKETKPAAKKKSAAPKKAAKSPA